MESPIANYPNPTQSTNYGSSTPDLVIKKPTSVWQKFKFPILVGGILLVLGSVAVVGLVISRSQESTDARSQASAAEVAKLEVIETKRDSTTQEFTVYYDGSQLPSEVEVRDFSLKLQFGPDHPLALETVSGGTIGSPVPIPSPSTIPTPPPPVPSPVGPSPSPIIEPILGTYKTLTFYQKTQLFRVDAPKFLSVQPSPISGAAESGESSQAAVPATLEAVVTGAVDKQTSQLALRSRVPLFSVVNDLRGGGSYYTVSPSNISVRGLRPGIGVLVELTWVSATPSSPSPKPTPVGSPTACKTGVNTLTFARPCKSGKSTGYLSATYTCYDGYKKTETSRTCQTNKAWESKAQTACSGRSACASPVPTVLPSTTPTITPKPSVVPSSTPKPSPKPSVMPSPTLLPTPIATPTPVGLSTYKLLNPCPDGNYLGVSATCTDGTTLGMSSKTCQSAGYWKNVAVNLCN